MYQVTIKGRNLKELKKAVTDINNELSSNDIVMGMEKDLTIEETIEKAVEPLTNNGFVVPSLEPVAEVTSTLDVGVELDSNNIPWDKRIHTEKRTKTINNAWKYRRNLDNALKLQVETELKSNVQRLANPVVIPAAPITPETPIVAPTPVLVEAPAPVVTPAPVVEVPLQLAPSPVPTLPTNGGHTVQTFSQNMPMILANLISDGKITQDYVNSLKGHFKVDELWSINDIQKAEMFDIFVQYKFITKVTL